jgi:uncharacterized protein YjbI with pentapeptide repeats
MRGLKRDLWKAGMVIAGILLLLVLMAWIPVSAAGAEVRASGLAAMVTAQATPTEDATVAALNKEKLRQELQQLQQSNSRGLGDWIWSNAAAVLSSFLSTLVVVIGALIGFRQWSVGRKDTQKKEADDRLTAQTKELDDRKAERDRRDEEQKRWLEDHKAEREKQAEGRFQSAIEGLSSEREEAKVGAAILLRTFLRPGYEQFYTQTFDLAVANLRPSRDSKPLQYQLWSPTQDSNTSLPLTTLRQALIVVFKEAFPLARSQKKRSPQFLDATDIQLDNAYLAGADLKQVWMPRASLRKVNLNQANLSGANLSGANLSKAKLNDADLSEADLLDVDLSDAYLVKANLNDANLNRVNLREAHLNGAKLNEAYLREADLSMAHLLLARLSEANLSKANLSKANLRWANLSKANLSEADLSGADLNKANLSEANLSGADLKDTDLHRVRGLTKEQLEDCKAKGAIIDEDPATSSSQPTVAPPPSMPGNDIQAPPAPVAQGSILTPDTGESSAPSSKSGPAS